MVWTTLAHYIDLELLREAYRLTRKNGAVGIDGQTAEEYGRNLEENLKSLLERLKSGTYKASPVRRVYIPKGDGKKKRPIGIPTFEDKILQRAVVMVLEAIYEEDFLSCSYGFRPGRSAHQALAELWQNLMNMDGGFVVEVDIERFFDTLEHSHLRDFLDKRVRDGIIRRVIGKWLKAGVLEEGKVQEIDETLDNKPVSVALGPVADTISRNCKPIGYKGGYGLVDCDNGVYSPGVTTYYCGGGVVDKAKYLCCSQNANTGECY
jgi:retron-type reverse transcriptase